MHAQGTEYWTEQKRLPDNADGELLRRVLDPHDTQVTVVAPKFEPKLDVAGLGAAHGRPHRSAEPSREAKVHQPKGSPSLPERDPWRDATLKAAVANEEFLLFAAVA